MLNVFFVSIVQVSLFRLVGFPFSHLPEGRVWTLQYSLLCVCMSSELRPLKSHADHLVVERLHLQILVFIINSDGWC